MLYAVTYEISGIVGPAGFIDTDRDEVVRFAKSIAEVSLDCLGDRVTVHEWYDLEGEEVRDLRSLLKSGDEKEVLDIIGQISDHMKGQKEGNIDIWEYKDIFELVDEHNVMSWCSKSLNKEIARIRKEYFSLIREISDEWSKY